MRPERSDPASTAPAARALAMTGRMLLLTGTGVLVAFALFSTDAGARMLGLLIGGTIAVSGLLVLCAAWRISTSGDARRRSR